MQDEADHQGEKSSSSANVSLTPGPLGKSLTKAKLAPRARGEDEPPTPKEALRNNDASVKTAPPQPPARDQTEQSPRAAVETVSQTPKADEVETSA